MTWAEVIKAYPDREDDDGNTKTLKHGYRWGVMYGAIDPENEDAKRLWLFLNHQIACADYDATKRGAV